MVSRRLYKGFALTLALAAVIMTSTVTAWATRCDDCSVTTSKMACCSGADAAISSAHKTAKISATMPECCQTSSVGDCQGVRYETQDAATSSSILDLAPTATQVVIATVEQPRTDVTPFVPVPTATPPPTRTTVLLL